MAELSNLSQIKVLYTKSNGENISGLLDLQFTNKKKDIISIILQSTIKNVSVSQNLTYFEKHFSCAHI